MKEYKAGKLLEAINSPADLKKLSEDDLSIVADELRQFIIDVVSEKGGHFSSSLGVVELTVALHYVYDTPDDQIVWDVGHQAYGHKILTGRKKDFHTNRVLNGISGFPKRSESEYDTFGVGHSSTSISAALGMAAANKYLNNQKKHIAVIGDGAMTGGLAFEGLNNGGTTDADLLVILNDNNCSIDPNVGALREYLTDITTSRTYNKVKDEIWGLLGKISKFGPNAQSIVQNIEGAIKSSLLNQSNLFESLNFRYFGPVDAHDVNHLVRILSDLKDIKGPKILHIISKKGKGYKPAEEGDSAVWHAPGVFNKETGEIIKVTPKSPTPPKFQDVFGHTIVELAEKNEKIIGITPAMPSGSSMNIMMKAMPDRAFDVGIAEQHAVTFSAGLATQGLLPFCNIYSTFMQRAIDQVVHDVCIQKLNVVFCMDRGGLVGADGPTHHGVFDIAFFRSMPNMIVSSPMNESELRNLMYTSQLENMGPFSIRYPRGIGSIVNWKTPMKAISVGTGRNISSGSDIAILSFGPMGIEAQKAVEQLLIDGISAAHYDMRFVKPIDETLLHEVFGKFDKIITVEDGTIIGGLGSAVIEFMADNFYKAQVIRLGIPDQFIEHGTQKELYALCEYDMDAMVKTAHSIVDKKDEATNKATG